MRDNATLAEQLGRDLSAVNWPAPDEIRTRARRRTVTTRLTTTVAVLLVIALVSALVAFGQPRERHVPQPATPPTPASLLIPDDALLQAEDVGTAATAQEWFNDAETVMPLGAGLDECLSDRHVPMQKTIGIRRMRDLSRAREKGTEPRAADFLLTQLVGRFGTGARQFVDDYRLAVAACDALVRTVPIKRNGRTVQVEVRTRWTTLAEGVAGDQSIVLRWETRAQERDIGKPIGEPYNGLVGLVRVKDLVTIISTRDGDPARMRELLRRAEARLCTVSSPLC